MKTALIRFFIFALSAPIGTPASSQINYIDQVGSAMRQVMPPTANCATAQFPFHCEFDRQNFEFRVTIDNDGTANMHFRGSKQEIETNLFRARVLFGNVFGILREQIEKCTYPLTPTGYNRDVELGQSRYKLNCAGVQTPDGTYNADIHRAIKD